MSVKRPRRLRSKTGHHVPVLIVEGSRGLAMGQMRDMPDTHGERLELMRSLGEAAARSGKLGRLEQVFFVSEGWMSVANQGKAAGLAAIPGSQSERSPDRLRAGTAGPAKSLRIFEMIRNPQQQVVDLAELCPLTTKDGTIEIPLLDAFSQGFRLAFLAQAS